MSELIAYHLEDGIATLTLSNGKVNAISPAVVSAFNEALDQAEKDRAVVVITGTPGILSGGYDLKVMTAGPKEAIGLVRGFHGGGGGGGGGRVVLCRTRFRCLWRALGCVANARFFFVGITDWVKVLQHGPNEVRLQTFTTRILAARGLRKSSFSPFV